LGTDKALALGAADYVTKPFDLDYLDCVINIHLSQADHQPCSPGLPPTMRRRA
jgi:DNA-binding response OmpR family regulator